MTRKTKTINGIKFEDDGMFVRGEWKTIFEMTKEELEYMLPRIIEERSRHRQYGDGRTARWVQFTIRRMRKVIDNYELLHAHLKK